VRQNYAAIRITMLLNPGIFLVYIFLAASSVLAQEPDSSATQRSPISLPVRVHLVQSQIPPLQATFDERQVREMFARINKVWAAAGIDWSLKEITMQPIASEEVIISAMRGTERVTSDFFLESIMNSKQSPREWNVFIVHDLTSVMGAPGIYVSSQQGLVVSELDPAGLNDPGRIAAHELGHSLTLVHVKCHSEGNLMSPGCRSADRTRLETAQIEDARKQAQLGEPVTSF
jgi:hypothetical protein